MRNRITKLYQTGFTLIEVLITITIIGVVFGVVVSSASSIQGSSRDAQRQSDLRALQAALQQYYADQHFYPATGSLPFGSALSAGGRTYLEKIPSDPISGTDTPYCYVAQESRTRTTCDNTSVNCHYYQLFANLEQGTTSTLTCNNKNYNFQITPL